MQLPYTMAWQQAIIPLGASSAELPTVSPLRYCLVVLGVCGGDTVMDGRDGDGPGAAPLLLLLLLHGLSHPHPQHPLSEGHKRFLRALTKREYSTLEDWSVENLRGKSRPTCSVFGLARGAALAEQVYKSYRIILEKAFYDIREDTLIAVKLDGVGPVDNRPSTDKLHPFV